jgi:tRNA A37 N6-isopentenylltransferase MiaA
MAFAMLLVSCGEEPPAPTAEHDETTNPWYGETLGQLTSMLRDATKFRRQGKADEASALIEKGEPLASQLLAVRHPTLAAMQAASDLDDLYGRMLLSNRHYAWAQFLFQKNVARWKHWVPSTPDTEARLKQAEDAVRECDKGMMKPAGR